MIKVDAWLGGIDSKSKCCDKKLKLAGDGVFVLTICSKCEKEHRRMRGGEVMKKLEEFINTPDVI